MKAIASVVLLGLLLFVSGHRAHAITLDAALAQTLEKNPAILEARPGSNRPPAVASSCARLRCPDIRGAGPRRRARRQTRGRKRACSLSRSRAALFSQPLFDVAIPASYRRGDIEVLLAEQRLNVAVIEQLHTARVAYYTAAYHESLLTLGEAQRQRLESNARAQTRSLRSRPRRSAGGHRGASARAGSETAHGRIAPGRERRAPHSSAARWATNLGPNAKIADGRNDLSFAALTLDADAESAAALERRADLKLARLLVRAAREDQRIIEAAYFPAIDANLSGDYIPVSDIRRGSEGSARRSDDIVSSELRWGAAYTWRVVDNGKVGGAVAQRRAAREINELVLAKLEADVPRQLAQLQNNLRSIAARQAALCPRHRRRRANRRRCGQQPERRPLLATRIPHRGSKLSAIESRPPRRRLPAKSGARRTRSRDRSLFSIFRRHQRKAALVAAVEVPVLEEVALADRARAFCCSPRSPTTSFFRSRKWRAWSAAPPSPPFTAPCGSSPLSSSKCARRTAGFIEFADEFAAGRGAMGRTIAKGDLLATIADETTARQLKQARADWQAAKQRAELPLPSSEPLKVAEDAVARLERLTSLSNVPAGGSGKSEERCHAFAGPARNGTDRARSQSREPRFRARKSSKRR